MRKAHIANILIAVIMSSMIYANYQYYVIPSQFLQSVGAAYQVRDGDAELISRLYTFHIELSAVSPGDASTYLPRYEPVDESTAARFFESFGIRGAPQGIIETGDIFFGADNRAMLTIYKFERTLSYATFFEPSPANQDPIDPERAAELAREFVAARALYTPHHEIETKFDGASFDLTFVNRLGGLKNYSFNTILSLDRYGRVLEFTYSDMTFERLSTHSLISPKEASLFLPADPDDSHVHITSVELVKTFENSIVQPAYLFQGVREDGSTFRSFVLAAQF
ncbi:MAG: hypothetical protein FWE20_05825 [Defluviitaleaceae bacterium]|nr:hypothetical protein [Defluviitaleaceae bacterium]